MLFLNADFWPLFWAVIGGGAGLTAVLSLFATTARRPHHGPTALRADATPRRAADATPRRAADATPRRDHEPVHPARAA